MSLDPVRLLDGNSLSSEEHALLEAGRVHCPAPYDATRGAARLRQEMSALSADEPVHSAGEAAVNATAPVALKIALKLLAVLVVALGAGMALKLRTNVDLQTAGEPRVAPAQAAEEQTPARSPDPELEVTQLADAPARAPAQEPAAMRSSVRKRRRTTGPMAPIADLAPPSTPAPAPVQLGGAIDVAETRPAQAAPRSRAAPPSQPADLPDAAFAQRELVAVARARALLEGDPEAALDVLDAIRRAQPTGYFVEERRALTVLALLRTGRRAIAREQGSAFLRAYPNGPFSESVRAGLSGL